MSSPKKASDSSSTAELRASYDLAFKMMEACTTDAARCRSRMSDLEATTRSAVESRDAAVEELALVTARDAKQLVDQLSSLVVGHRGGSSGGRGGATSNNSNSSAGYDPAAVIAQARDLAVSLTDSLKSLGERFPVLLMDGASSNSGKGNAAAAAKSGNKNEDAAVESEDEEEEKHVSPRRSSATTKAAQTKAALSPKTVNSSSPAKKGVAKAASPRGSGAKSAAALPATKKGAQAATTSRAAPASHSGAASKGKSVVTASKKLVPKPAAKTAARKR